MTEIIGHRAVGVSETKLEDFEKALRLGLDMIEFDLRMTKEGEIVVFHGPPGREGKNILREKTYGDIKEEAGFSPPRFSDVVDLCGGRIRFDLEIKESDILPHVLDILGSREGHIVTSFLDSVVFEAKQEGMEAGLILGMWGIGARQRLSEVFPAKRKTASRADFLLPERRIYKASPWKHPFSQCIIWGVNEEKDMQDTFRDHRVRGIITDFPEQAIQAQKQIFTT